MSLVSVVILAILSALTIPGAALADTDETREQIFEQARVGRGLWLGFQDRVSGLRLRLNEEAYVGGQYDDSELHWSRTGLSIAGALPFPGGDQGVAISFSTAVVTPISEGSTAFLDLPGTNDDPFDTLLDSALRIGGQFDVGYGFGVELNAGLSARHEVDAEFKAALATGASFALSYRRGDWLRLRLGVGIGTAIERAKVSASPVFRLRVRPVPGLWLETDGTSGRIEWEYSKRLEFSAFGGVDSKRYRLASRGRTVGAGSLELRKSEVGVGLRKKLGRSFRLSLEVAVVLGQHLTVLDDHRQTVDARDTREPTGALRISFEWKAPRPPDRP